MRLCVMALTVATLAGCRSSAQFRAERPACANPTIAAAGIVFVADGAGDYRDLSVNLNRAVAESSVPLQVETVEWSNGYGRLLADQTDSENHQQQGRRLAESVLRYRCAHPGRPVYLIGHSAGNEIVLTAAGMLPPDSIDRIVLLAPSVCAYRDLRPALRSARGGIDAFTSQRDRFVLGLAMRISGTTEGDCTIAAGRVGFRPQLTSPLDVALYRRLRQHPWSPEMRAYGHDGGHFGVTEPDFLRSHVVPLLAVCR